MTPEEKAMYAWAIYEYREHPQGLYHTCFIDGFLQGYEEAEKDITEAAKVLVDSVEKYVRQECSRSTLLSMKDKLKELLEK